MNPFEDRKVGVGVMSMSGKEQDNSCYEPEVTGRPVITVKLREMSKTVWQK